MIPKIIHYCWFGKKEKPIDVLNYIETWKKHLPEFEIKEWNEDNFNINEFEYTKEAYYAKKYAFVSDVARLYALVNEGGLYLDTDIRILKSIPNSFFMSKGFLSFENDINISTAIMAFEPSNAIAIEFYKTYSKTHFFYKGKFDLTPNVNRLTNILTQKGLHRNNTKQQIELIDIYPQELFSAKMYITGKYYNTEQTYAIHDFKATWINDRKRFIKKIKNRIHELKTIINYYLHICI